jgi:signal transduction histidine kinase
MDSTNRKTLSQIAFVVALVFIVAIASLYFYNIFKWGKIPDFGFYRRAATGLREIGVITEVGRKAGMEVGDRILKINGKPFSNNEEFYAARHQGLGEKNAYLIERKGQTFEVAITNSPLGIKVAFIRSGLPYVVGLCYVLIGIVVFLLKPHRRTTWAFFLFGAILGLYLIFLLKLGELKPLWLWAIHLSLYIFSPAVIFHLALNFPAERTLVKNHPIVQTLPYLASALLLITIGYATPDMALMNVPRIWRIILVGYLVFSLLFFLGNCLRLWLTSPSEIVKLRSKMILFGAAISTSIPLLETVMNTLFHIYLVPSFNYYLPFFLAFPFFVGYSIVKHNLFDIDGAIRRTFGYVLVTIGIAILYTLSVFVPPLFVGEFELAQSTTFPLLFTLVIVFFFNLARGRIQKFIDRIFYRLEYDYQETVEKISEKMRSLLNLDEIEKSIREIALNALFVDKSAVLVMNPKNRVYESLTPSTNLKLTPYDPLIQKIAEKRKELTQYDIEEDPSFEKEKEACKATFKKLEASLLIPIIFEDDLIGLMTFGDKKSGKFYRGVDIKLLKTLANQGAVAIENARLHQARVETLENTRKELERLNRAKSIALDHLSHEMKTPLSIIQGNIRLLKRKLEMQVAPEEGKKSFEALDRQLNRLLEIQRETDEIIRSYQKLEEEPISLFPFAEQTLEKVKEAASHREIHFHLEGQKDLSILLAPKILKDLLEGLLKNAIENTPDEGMIRIVLEQKAQWILLKVQDFGIGITQMNQRHLFEGLFHTQDTERYASKKPYDFNAGGKGLDLLKMKVYGQRLGFDISVGSQRCIHLPTDRDSCPGRISLCSYCQGTRDCFSSGGSTFCVSFPIEGNKEHGKETSSS